MIWSFPERKKAASARDHEGKKLVSFLLLIIIINRETERENKRSE